MEIVSLLYIFSFIFVLVRGITNNVKSFVNMLYTFVEYSNKTYSDTPLSLNAPEKSNVEN